MAALGRPAWEVTAEDIDRVVGELAVAGRAASTRREYVQIFKGFHRFLQARKAGEIEAAFGVRLVCPVDEFNASRHVGDDSAAVLPPPTPERVAEFFEFLKTRIATARKYAPAARDHALFRTLYRAGLRSEEAALLERCDVHFGRGPLCTALECTPNDLFEVDTTPVERPATPASAAQAAAQPKAAGTRGRSMPPL